MCGSAVAFNPVTFHDGTVMMWYKEFGANDGNPQQLFNPLANRAMNPTDKSVIRSPADFGFDLSLVGGRYQMRSPTIARAYKTSRRNGRVQHRASPSLLA